MKTLDPEFWTKASSKWATVTPLILDRFPKDQPGKTAPDLIFQACERVGLPPPEFVHFGRYSPVPGVPPVAHFQFLRDKPGQRRIALHVYLEWDVPVEGPILLGAGRHFGLGLCRPLANRPEVLA